MTTSNDLAFQAICKEAERNPSIIGLFLGGSRGKGMPKPHSDYDVYIIVKDGMAASVESSLKGTNAPFHEFSKENDIIVLTMDGLKAYPPWAGDGYETYDFLYLKAIVDKTGMVQAIIKEKSIRHVKPEDINLKIDAYINFFYRSLKCIRDGYDLGARLEANTSMAILLDLLFAIHDRPTPYGKYMVWELDKHPLEKLPVTNQVLLHNVKQVLDDASIDAQRFLFGIVENICREAGFNAQIDGWGEEPLRFMREFKPGK
nr:hypothetical protein [Candidatus Sigynarchaeota archaeon]